MTVTRKVSRFQARDEQSDPPYDSPRYASTARRAPTERPIPLLQTLSELTGPVYGHELVQRGDADLTTNAGTGTPALGERIIVEGCVLLEIKATHEVTRHDVRQLRNYLKAARVEVGLLLHFGPKKASFTRLVLSSTLT